MTPQVREQVPAKLHPLQSLWVLFLGLALLIAQSLAAQAQSRPDTFADLAEKVSPSVVNITTSTTVPPTPVPRPLFPKALRLKTSSGTSWIATKARAGRGVVKLWALAS